MIKNKPQKTQPVPEDVAVQSRRDFLTLTAGAIACTGLAITALPFVTSMNPDANEIAMGSVEVDISKMQLGQTMTVMWRGTPVFIKRRTLQEIKEARETPLSDLRDPEADEARVLKGKEEWLVTVAVCTHLGCVPIANKGEFHGWFCPCHGSHYDTSGRIRKGPAPKNLLVPQYTFLNDTTIKIG